MLSQVHLNDTRQGDILLTRKSTLQYGLKSIRYVGAKSWNSISHVITGAVMHRVCSLKIEVCYLDNAAFLGCFLFGLPSTRSRHCYCKKTNSNSASALQQSDSSFIAFPSFQTSTGKNIFPSGCLKRGERCEGAIALLKCAGAI